MVRPYASAHDAPRHAAFARLRLLEQVYGDDTPWNINDSALLPLTREQARPVPITPRTRTSAAVIIYQAQKSEFLHNYVGLMGDAFCRSRMAQSNVVHARSPCRERRSAG